MVKARTGRNRALLGVGRDCWAQARAGWTRFCEAQPRYAGATPRCRPDSHFAGRTPLPAEHRVRPNPGLLCEAPFCGARPPRGLNPNLQPAPPFCRLVSLMLEEALV